MPFKKKATPGIVQFNKLIAELSEKREKIKAHSIKTWFFRTTKKS